MKNKAGDLIFLTRRKKGKNESLVRRFISGSIARITRFKHQDLEKVKVHVAIIYEYNSLLWVRDMDMEGDERYPVDIYSMMMKGRIEVVQMPDYYGVDINRFNVGCEMDAVRYDFANTFFWQVIRGATGKWFGKNTPYKRNCVEDASRMYNLINPIFKNVEKTNPNELYRLIKTNSLLKTIENE